LYFGAASEVKIKQVFRMIKNIHYTKGERDLEVVISG
jgi:hypothetical protein